MASLRTPNNPNIRISKAALTAVSLFAGSALLTGCGPVHANCDPTQTHQVTITPYEGYEQLANAYAEASKHGSNRDALTAEIAKLNNDQMLLMGTMAVTPNPDSCTFSS